MDRSDTLIRPWFRYIAALMIAALLTAVAVATAALGAKSARAQEKPGDRLLEESSSG